MRPPRDPRPMAGPNSGLFGSYVPYAQAPSAAPAATKGGQVMMGGNENTGAKIQKPPGRHDRPPGGPYTSVTRSRGIAPSVLHPAAAGLLIRRSVGRTGAPASIPKQPGRAARFTKVGAAGQIALRTDLPHYTSRHRVAVAGARDLPPLSEPERFLPDRRPPEPLFASASSPELALV